MHALCRVPFHSDVSRFSVLEGWVRGEVEEMMGKKACGSGVFMRSVPVYFEEATSYVSTGTSE